MASGTIVQFRPVIGRYFEQLAVSTSVQVLTPSKYKDTTMSGGAMSALITIETGNIRITYDGTTPSGTVGHLILAGERLVLTGQNQMASFKCYQDSNSVASTISVTYEFE